ncbi:MAG: phosphoglucomutase [Chloroflexus aggregans]|uniref:Phosphoglucomutase n=1 Tax=Chloroflexus aggregans TaxID=152260 RepID=A0A2J6XAD3_9CHLR|nr:MAG: phosphoglucomutase [Chloroflexus aggregans]
MSVYRRPLLQAWEAAYTAELTLDQLRRRAATVGAVLASQRARCLIAFDTRFLANLFAQTLAYDLLAQGVEVMLANAPAPLPAIHHALDQRIADCALYVSARNRPYYIGGLLLVADDQSGLSLDPARDPLPPVVFPPTKPFKETIDLRSPYLDALRHALDLDAIRRLPLTFFVDAMAGTTAGMVTALFGEGGQARAIEINRDPDPLFARGAPQPFESPLNRLRKLVRESDSHLGVALAGDGTALAVVDPSGEVLDPFEASLLLAAHVAQYHRQRGLVIAPPPSPHSLLRTQPKQLAAWQEANGMKIELAGDSLHGERQPVVAMTTAGETLLSRWSTCPDGLLAGLLFCEAAARSNGGLRALCATLRSQFSA